MTNNRNYILISLVYLFLLSGIFFFLFGYGFMSWADTAFGPFEGLGGLPFAIFSLFVSLFGFFLSWLIFFLTIPKIYKKTGANFNFKRPVLFTSIIIFILGNILFYLAMLVWTSIK